MVELGTRLGPLHGQSKLLQCVVCLGRPNDDSACLASRIIVSSTNTLTISDHRLLMKN